MRRVRQRATDFGGGAHGFPVRASSSSHRASATFRPPTSDSLYAQEDVPGQALALGPFVPGRSVAAGAAGAPGVFGRRRPLLRRAPRRTGHAQGAQDVKDGPSALGAAALLPPAPAAGGAQDQRGTGGTESVPKPGGAVVQPQKAGEDVPSRSSHLAQKILNAIDYMASPGAPKASPLGGAGPSALGGSGGKEGLGLGSAGAGSQGGGLRLGEGELSDRVKRSMAAAQQPPPMAPSAFEAGVPAATAGTGIASAGTPEDGPGSSRSRKSGAGFRIRFEVSSWWGL